MIYGMQMLGIRSYSAMKLEWRCILISKDLSEDLQESETTHDENNEL